MIAQALFNGRQVREREREKDKLGIFKRAFVTKLRLEWVKGLLRTRLISQYFEIYNFNKTILASSII